MTYKFSCTTWQFSPVPQCVILSPICRLMKWRCSPLNYQSLNLVPLSWALQVVSKPFPIYNFQWNYIIGKVRFTPISDSLEMVASKQLLFTNIFPRGYHYLHLDVILCIFSTLGYYSHRDIVNGSWYIQDLCETLRKHRSSLEFTELLTVVNRKVSDRKVYVFNKTNAVEKKQIPCFTSMLTKKLYFHPKSK